MAVDNHALPPHTRNISCHVSEVSSKVNGTYFSLSCDFGKATLGTAVTVYVSQSELRTQLGNALVSSATQPGNWH